MGLFCPFCSEPITPGTTTCPNCDHIYSPDTLSFIDLFVKGQDESPKERRNHRRFPINLKAVYVSPKDFMDHYIFDLSLGGLFVETNNFLDQGQTLELRIFLLDEAEPMEIPCQVMWARREEDLTDEGEILPPGMGVEFVKLSTENIERLISVLKRSLEHSKC